MARLLKISRQPDGQPEIFYSIQGEGVNSGRPAVFLRLALCNLACTWCDTKYTWDWDNFDRREQITIMHFEDIEGQILKYPCEYLVVTGGEPMIQQSQLIPLLGRLKSKGFLIEIETNGTIVPRQDLTSLVDHWSVSPKLANSGNVASSREVPEAYRFFVELSGSHFKFVIQNENEFAEIQDTILRYRIPCEKIVLMPEARSREVLLDRSRWLVELCKKNGYLFSTRLQVLLWGDMRSV
jgi:7-carboxy-7-deazaguanine synthase